MNIKILICSFHHTTKPHTIELLTQQTRPGIQMLHHFRRKTHIQKIIQQ